jgi:RND superfamily putative drug exporter
VSRFFAAIGRFAVRFRWVVVVAWIAATIGALHFFPSLDSVAGASDASFLPASSPSMQAAGLAAPFQGVNETAVPVVIARDGAPFGAADLAVVDRLASRLGRVAGVRQVRELGVSRDGRAAELRVLATVNLDAPGPAHQLVTGLRRAIAAGGLSGGLPSGLHAHLAGPLATQDDASQSSGHAGDLGEDLSIVFILALLLVVFRSLLAPLLTLAPAVLVTQLSGPVIAEASRAGLRVSSLTQILILVLVLGAGTDYGLFLVFRVRESLRDGLDPGEAVVRAMARTGESVTFSAGTVIAALLTLLLATFGLYSNLGVPLAIAIALMLAAGLTLLPALLAIFGRAAFWPSVTSPGAGRPGWWGRVAGRVVAHPGATLALGVVGFGVLATAAIGYVPGGFGGTPPAPRGSDSAAGNALLAAHFPAASGNPTSVLLRFGTPVSGAPVSGGPVSGGPDLVAAERRLAAVPLFSGVTGPADAGEVARSQFISPDGRTVRFEVALAAGDPGSDAAMAQVPAIRAAVAAVARDVGARAYGVTGQAPVTYDISRVSDHDLLRIVPVAIAAIAILLALVLRSLVAPVYLIVSVVLSYLAAFGLSVLLFQGDGLPYFVPFLMFLFLLALGEDYNILVMTRIREEASRVPLRQAVRTALARTGSTVTSAGLVLAGTFGVFALVEGAQPGGAPYRAVLASLALGILLDAFVVRTLLVPSAVALLGRLNWWPSAYGAPGPELSSGRPLAGTPGR